MLAVNLQTFQHFKHFKRPRCHFGFEATALHPTNLSCHPQKTPNDLCGATIAPLLKGAVYETTTTITMTTTKPTTTRIRVKMHATAMSKKNAKNGKATPCRMPSTPELITDVARHPSIGEEKEWELWRRRERVRLGCRRQNNVICGDLSVLLEVLIFSRI